MLKKITLTGTPGKGYFLDGQLHNLQGLRRILSPLLLFRWPQGDLLKLNISLQDVSDK